MPFFSQLRVITAPEDDQPELPPRDTASDALLPGHPGGWFPKLGQLLEGGATIVLDSMQQALPSLTVH